jgi:hypothetical protein
MFILFFPRAFCTDCASTFSTSLGLEQFDRSTNDGDILCLNVTAYPFALVFHRFSDDTVYRDCFYPVEGPPECRAQALRFLPLQRSLLAPAHILEIETPTATDLSFMTVTLPGMCSDGIYFSSLPFGTLRLHPGGSDFHNLTVFDDKCVVFGPQEIVSLTMFINSDDEEDQLYVYYSFTNFTSVSGNSTVFVTDYNARERPLFVRVVADDFRPAREVLIAWESSANYTRSPRFDYALPPTLFQVCDEEKKETAGAIAIALIVFIAALAIGLLVWICAVSVRQTSVRSRGLRAGGFSTDWGDRTHP